MKTTLRTCALTALAVWSSACTPRDEAPPISAEPTPRATRVDASTPVVQPATTGTAPLTVADAAVEAEVRPTNVSGPDGCPKDLPGPAMVAIPTLDGRWYCIDKTEVTQAQYAAFMKAKGVDINVYPSGDTSGQPAECTWNTSWMPRYEPGGCFGSDCAFDPFGKYPDTPMGCVDWCDAHGYCAWAGKRLCGRIGGGDAKLQGEATSAARSEWFNACSQGGTTAYPYGNTYEPGKCQDVAAVQAAKESGMSEDAACASIPASCHGSKAPYDQIQSMSGSRMEWTAECDWTRYPPECNERGGSMGSEKDGLRCDYLNDHTTPAMGGGGVAIRCCYAEY